MLERFMHTVLVIGFYNRDNAGDEMYKVAIPMIFSNSAPTIKFQFACMDDIKSIPPYIDTVICGGGDIINAYFMKKAQTLFANYTGKVYAFSVGIPYASEAHYLDIFDHVFTRSKIDFDIAVSAIGANNVTYVPDAAFILKNVPHNDNTVSQTQRITNINDDLMNTSLRSFTAPLTHQYSIIRRSRSATYMTLISHQYNTYLKSSEKKIKIGICLAQPVFYENNATPSMIASIAKAIIDLSHRYKSLQKELEFHLIPFNYSSDKPESDLVINELLFKTLQTYKESHEFNVINYTDIDDPMTVFDLVQKVDIVVGMRYHSINFSLVLNKKIIALYCSPKIERAIQNWGGESDLIRGMYKLPEGKPEVIDSQVIFDLIDKSIQSMKSSDTSKELNVDLDSYYSHAAKLMFQEKKSRNLLISLHLNSFETALDNCKTMLTAFLGITCDSKYEQLLHETRYLSTYDKGYCDIARIVCYATTKSISSPYLWGLVDNMKKDDFCLYEAIKYIWEDHWKNTHRDTKENYYPVLNNFERKVFINIDTIFKSEFKHFHRFGWDYAIGGLMNLDAQKLSRYPTIMVDTYVDRTFHWGMNTLKLAGLLPYTKPWIGFIHHTLDTSHSTYNCLELFNNTMFLQSLQCCKGLIALTNYLARDLEKLLQYHGFKIPVKVVYHPMDSVDNNFTIEKFINNKNKKLVQIGAWLRNPYAIYALDLWKNKLDLNKCALRGKEMDQYFKPAGFLESLENEILHKSFNYMGGRSVCTCCSSSDGICRSSEDCICRSNISISGNTIVDSVNNVNKYCYGLLEHIEDADKSVNIIDRLANDEYDILLSENIVFLNLVDCSAVNTVLECILRNTVLVVNRHPALEEMLGADYPGFYDGLTDAMMILNDIEKIREIYNHLCKLEKKQYHLNTFVSEIQDFVASLPWHLPVMSTYHLNLLTEY